MGYRWFILETMQIVTLKRIHRCALKFKKQYGNILVVHSDFLPLTEKYHKLAHFSVGENAFLTTEKGVKTCQNR